MRDRAERERDRRGQDTELEAVLASLITENVLLRLHLGTDEQFASVFCEH